MNKHAIIINGTGGSGKDTFVEYCNNITNGKVYNVSSVDKVKAAASILGWSGAKTEDDRKFLADLKSLVTNYNDSCYKYMVNCFEEFVKDEYKSLMFLHIREPEEIQRMKDKFCATTLLITNSNIKAITSNSSDGRVKEYNYDYTIDNSGTLEELEHIAKEFIYELEIL